MPDICMCKNQICTQKETCYRFMAEPNPYNQSYCTFGQNKNNECEYYWDNKPQEKVIIE
jgi:hypothetical protein